MVRIILLYGVLSGAIIIGIISLGLSLGPDSFLSTEWAGYLVMLVALSMIFAAVKRYRDVDLGGVIRFSTALTVGLGIAVVSSVVYVAIWETYLWTTDYRFFADYTQSVIDAKRAGGASAAELTKLASEMAEMGVSYAKTPYRLGITFLEIFPVGLIVSIVSAAVLRNSRILPARRANNEEVS